MGMLYLDAILKNKISDEPKNRAFWPIRDLPHPLGDTVLETLAHISMSYPLDHYRKL